jgi:hypothetical protein
LPSLCEIATHTAVRFVLLLPAVASSLPLPPNSAAGYPALESAESTRVTQRVAVLARALPPRRSLRAAAWALGRELGLAEAWRTRGGIEAVLHGVGAGVSGAPPEVDEVGEEGIEAEAGAGSEAASVLFLLSVGVGALASELAHEDGFLYVALRAPRGERGRSE